MEDNKLVKQLVAAGKTSPPRPSGKLLARKAILPDFQTLTRHHAGVAPRTNIILGNKMRVKTASIEYQRKFNLGNYESIELSVGFWTEVEEGEDEGAIVELMFDLAKREIKKQLPARGVNLPNFATNGSGN